MGTKYDEGLKVLGELRERLAGAEERATEAKRLAEEAKTERDAAREKIEAIPNLVTDSTLKAYKKLRTEGADVPANLKRLLERAESREEVDAVMEAISNAQASRYSFLPGGPNSRSLREAIADTIPEDDRTKDATSEVTSEEAADAEQVREVTIRQLGGRHRKG